MTATGNESAPGETSPYVVTPEEYLELASQLTEQIAEAGKVYDHLLTIPLHGLTLAAYLGELVKSQPQTLRTVSFGFNAGTDRESRYIEGLQPIQGVLPTVLPNKREVYPKTIIATGYADNKLIERVQAFYPEADIVSVYAIMASHIEAITKLHRFGRLITDPNVSVRFWTERAPEPEQIS